MLVSLNDFITPKKFFKWKEVLWLNSISTYHSPNQQEVDNIIELIIKFDNIREFIDKPFKVHCLIRPIHVVDINNKFTGFDYNAKIGGAKGSAHINRKSYRWTFCRIVNRSNHEYS